MTRRSRPSLLAVVLVIGALVPLAMRPADGLAPKRTAWQGPVGIRETNAEIMARERSTPSHAPSRLVRAENTENTRGPNRRALHQAPASEAASSSNGANIREAAPHTPQTIGQQFIGPTLDDTGAFPPDTMGAAGPSQFLITLNGRFRSYSKANGLADGVLNADSDVFFNSVLPIGAFSSDPRVRYDRGSGRWFITMISAISPTFPTNNFMLAVSSGGTLTGPSDWTFYSFAPDFGPSPNADTGNFADYDTLGVDANALYIGANMFGAGPSGSYQHTSLFVVQKASVLSGGTILVTPFRNLTSGSAGAGPYTPQGVDNLDNSVADGYVVGVDNATFNKLQIRRISSAGTLSPTISGNLSVTVATTALPIAVPQTGGGQPNLDALDDRLFNAVIRNGHLWAAHNIGTNASGVASGSASRDSTRWYDIDSLGTTPSVSQFGTVFDGTATARSFWVPSITVSGQNHMAIGGSTSSTTNHADAFTVGKLSGGSLGLPNIYTSSTSAYDAQGGGTQRWGDYSFTSVDPNDDMTMWTINEFANATDKYAVQVAKLLAPPPATPAVACPSAVPTGQSSVSVMVTGTSIAGSGFFDPGPGFSNRIGASVAGGVIVNGVTYVDPTHVNLDLDTTGASAGAKNVTITNPDGQPATGSNILTIGTPGASSICGRVFEDKNGNAAQDPGDGGLGGWTVFLDTDNNGVLNGGEPSTTSDPIGAYQFAGLANGTYHVREVVPSGWKQTTTNPDLVFVSATAASGIDFGNFQASISGQVFNDLDQNGAKNGSEAGLSGQTVFLDANNNGNLDGGEVSTPTGGSGTYIFNGLGPATYRVREVLQSGWNQSTTIPSPIVISTSGTNVSGVDFGTYDASSTTTTTPTTTTTTGGGGGGGGGGGPPPPDPVTRLFGSDRIATAIAISNNAYPAAGAADAVVLARSDGFADALAGTPFAAAKRAPLLLTPSNAAIDSRVSTEISRVLSPGKVVFILGGPGAVDPSVDTALKGSGYQVVRYQGADRYATAVAVAHDGLNDPPTALLATGTDFADALAGGAAAANVPGGAAVLLTNGSTMPPATASYLSAHPPVATYALGGPAAAAAPSAQAIAGADRFETSVKVAQKFFTGPVSAAVAYAFNFPDALAGGAHIATRHSPLLLVDSGSVPGTVANYLVANKLTINNGYVYGGTAVISDPTLQAFQTAIT